MKYYTKLTEKAIYQNVKSSVMIHQGNEESFIICGWLPADTTDEIEKSLIKLKVPSGLPTMLFISWKSHRQLSLSTIGLQSRISFMLICTVYQNIMKWILQLLWL